MRQRGFGMVEAIIIVGVIAVVSLVGWRVWDSNNNTDTKDEDKKSNTSQTQQATKPAAQEDTTPEGYKSYADPADRFSFVYPETWEQKDLTGEDAALVSLARPSAQTTSLVVYRWDTVAAAAQNFSMRDHPAYANINEYITNPENMMNKLGEVTVNGQVGYEVIVPGASGEYGIFFDRPDGVYLVSFADVSQKSEFSAEDQKIIDSFTLQ